MDFNFTQDENDFRQEIKDWLSKNLSQRISNKVKKFQRLDKNDYEEFRFNKIYPVSGCARQV